jgi:hypothetical protein
VSAQPRLERVEVPQAEIDGHLRALDERWVTPDGDEIADGRSYHKLRAQIRDGHYYRLVFPDGATREQIATWYRLAENVLRWHALGLL